MDGPAHPLLTASDWLDRCSARIAELDPTIARHDVAELAQALLDRPSCRALRPERAAELLFQKRLSPSRWGALEDEA
jgi:hypothetical protein